MCVLYVAQNMLSYTTSPHRRHRRAFAHGAAVRGLYMAVSPTGAVAVVRGRRTVVDFARRRRARCENGAATAFCLCL